jgi:hypothetical protein
VQLLRGMLRARRRAAGRVAYGSGMEILVTLDCMDTEAQARFWLDALAPLRYRRASDTPPYVTLTAPKPAPTLLLQRVPEPKQGKNRMHLDLEVEDLTAEVERMERLGARRLSGEVAEHGFRWVVLADPEGNEFCVYVPPPASGTAD